MDVASVGGGVGDALLDVELSIVVLADVDAVTDEAAATSACGIISGICV